ncbi:hypothetical protein BK011_08940 [Tenericutes bacterium MZ-XQ]|nr:hypothetical protein BK011_08940 [Tenericutes bacterium MZ-XQ]
MKQFMIQDLIDYIEAHIEDDLTLDELSDVSSYSRFYLHRMFDLIIGSSVINYVRLRKMQYARYCLSKDERVIDVALKYGYQSERSFRRAFKQVFQLNPSSIKHQDYHIPEKIQFDLKKGMTMIHYLSDLKIVECDAYYALGTKVISKHPEIDSIEQMTHYKHLNHIDPFTEIGIDISVDASDSDSGKRGYAYYLVVDKETFEKHHDSDIIKHHIPSSKYAMITIDDPFKDPFERIPMGWKKLITELESKYTPKKGLGLDCFEEKVVTMTGTIMNIYVAIE